MSEFILGLDGGGTKTLLAVANRAGEVLGVIAGSGINPFDQPEWKSELTRILMACPIKPAQLAFSSFGMPGYGESESVSNAQLEVTRTWAGKYSVVQNDVAVAFTGALAGKPGVLVLAGTGSMAWAENAAHQEVRVGGWGEGFGDEGSAYWIGLCALQKLSWTLDGRLEDMNFRDALLKDIGIRGSELVNWFYTLEHPRPKIAARAKAVDQLAVSGNPSAKTILLEAAQHLTNLAKAARQKLNLERPMFSFAGSVFNSQTVHETVKQNLEPDGQWFKPRGSPLAGALLDAAIQAGWKTDETWLEKINFELGKKQS
jgi:N-acetylglucosamine kinase-like BadF-type ATPase